jgi:hypothetical protein
MRAERDQLQASVTELSAQLIDHRGRLETTINGMRQLLDDPRGLKPVTMAPLPAPARTAIEADAPAPSTMFEVATAAAPTAAPAAVAAPASTEPATAVEESFDDLRWSGDRD